MAIKLKPDNALAHNNLGIALFHAKMTEEAIDYFKEAIRILPDYANAHFNLGTALLEKGEELVKPLLITRQLLSLILTSPRHVTISK